MLLFQVHFGVIVLVFILPIATNERPLAVRRPEGGGGGGGRPRPPGRFSSSSERIQMWTDNYKLHILYLREAFLCQCHAHVQSFLLFVDSKTVSYKFVGNF